jgi:two-component system phosphate regulon response regulator OmpR
MNNSQKKRLLIVDDDIRLCDLLNRYLSDHGYTCLRAHNGQDAQKLLSQEPFDCIILDHMMPLEDGLTFLEKIRKKNISIPVLMLTACNSIDDRVSGLEKGASDYLGKPFDPRELILRIKNLISFQGIPQSNVGNMKIGDLYVDKESMCLWKDDQRIFLTSTEWKLLTLFLDDLGSPLSRDFLASALGVQVSLRTVDVQINRLRQKIEKDPKNPSYLRTIRHEGYGLWC